MMKRTRRTTNKPRPPQLRINVTVQIEDLLVQIANSGLIGSNRVQVANRFIEEGVMKALDNPHFQLKRKTKHR